MSKKITLYEFRSLPDQEQYDVVFQHGTLLEAKIQCSQSYALYAVDMFFVKVEYDNTRNKINNKIAFVAGEKINRYSQVNIDNSK